MSYVSTSFSTRNSLVSIIVTSLKMLEKSAQSNSPTFPPPTITTFTNKTPFLSDNHIIKLLSNKVNFNVKKFHTLN